MSIIDKVSLIKVSSIDAQNLRFNVSSEKTVRRINTNRILYTWSVAYYFQSILYDIDLKEQSKYNRNEVQTLTNKIILK